MDSERIVAVVMAGGEGTRFWPRSRRNWPKQFLSFDGGPSLLRQAVDRLRGFLRDEQILVVTGADHVAAAQKDTDLPPESVLGEPCRRDTAACIGYAGLLTRAIRPDAVMVVVSADHLVPDAHEFGRVLLRAAELAAASDVLVAVGLRPDRPSTGFGYIETGAPVDDLRPVAMEVIRFREKPDVESARRFVLAGRFLWNGGMFAFQAETILHSIESYLPELHAVLEGIKDPRDPAQVEAAYARAPRISIDFGIMERAPNRVVVEADFAWDDVGTFEAVARHAQADENKNLARGAAVFLECHDVLVDNDDSGLVVVSGVSDVLIVRTKDAVLVIPRKDAEKVKGAVRRLEELGYTDYL